MIRDGLVRWTGLVAAASMAAFADVAIWGPGAPVTIACGSLAVGAWWLFAFAAIRAMIRDEAGSHRR